MHAYWEEKQKFTSPSEIFNHLLGQQVASGKVTPERAAVCHALFSNTFVPDQVTGYLAKHRDPLVIGLGRLYNSSKRGKAQKLYLMEGDLCNIGGLNTGAKLAAHTMMRDDPDEFKRFLVKYGLPTQDYEPEVLADALGIKVANRVLHTVAQLFSHCMANVANTTPVRLAGDELRNLLQMKDGNMLGELFDGVTAAMQYTAEFVENCGLRLLDSGKSPGDRRVSGTGMGAGISLLQPIASADERHALEHGITSGKAGYYTHLHRNSRPFERPLQEIDIARIDAQVNSAYAKFSSTDEQHTVVPQLNPQQFDLKPEDQRRRELIKILKERNPGVKLSREEFKMLVGTHALIQRKDFVVNLPMMENMQSEMLPWFKDNFGQETKAKMLLFDFSGMANGNVLAHELGDAMAREFKQVVRDAIKAVGFEKYTPTLCVDPGGKFAMYVGCDFKDEHISRLQDHVTRLLAERSSKPLPLDSETVEKIEEHMQKPDIAALYGGSPVWNSSIRMCDLVSKKSKLAGPRAVVTASHVPIEFDSHHELELMALLRRTKKVHDAHISSAQSRC